MSRPSRFLRCVCIAFLAASATGCVELEQDDSLDDLASVESELAVKDFMPVGGPGGFPYYASATLDRVYAVTVWYGSWVDGISVHARRTNGTTYEQHFGGWGGSAFTFWLYEGEQITSMRGMYSQYIDGVQFHTSFGRTSPWLGGIGGRYGFTQRVPEGFQLAGFHGKAGRFVDSIGIVVAAP